MTDIQIHDGSPKQDPLDDDFLLALIESVQRNPCVFNRYDPLHKVTEYKHEIWKMISLEIGYDGEPIELERKWKHMRDKYVRLRKQDKQRTPLKQTNKWYNYYHRMSFLDPYVEHRNRKRQKDYINMKMAQKVKTKTKTEVGVEAEENEEDVGRERDAEEVEEEDLLEDVMLMRGLIKGEPAESGYESPHSSNSSGDGQPQRNIDSPEPDLEEGLGLMLYGTLLGEKTNESASNDWELLSEPAPREVKTRKRKNPSKISPTVTSSVPEKKPMMREVEESLKGLDEDQVTFFIRSIAKTLVDMDREKFAIARIEISKVLYNIEFGKIQYSEHGAK